MRVVFAGILINEAAFIAANLSQHYSFADKIILVEGADQRWPRNRVDEDGLSLDATADIIRSFPDPEHKIEFIQHGWAQDKCELRNQYAERCEDGDAVFVVDADEFLSHESFVQALGLVAALPAGCVRIPHIHLWKGPGQIVIGRYWDVPHDRVYRWREGALYLAGEHNHPADPETGKLLRDEHLFSIDRRLFQIGDGTFTHPEPFWLHWGFARDAVGIRDKNAYYVARGEAHTRPDTTRDRAAWFETEVPPGATVLPWGGPYPEIMP